MEEILTFKKMDGNNEICNKAQGDNSVDALIVLLSSFQFYSLFRFIQVCTTNLFTLHPIQSNLFKANS